MSGPPQQRTRVELEVVGEATPQLTGASDDAGADASEDLQLGGKSGRYVLQRRIGEGGMGVVYEAHDPGLDRQVAVKLLWPGLRRAGGERRLRREAQAMAQLSHPNVVQVFDVGREDDRVYIAMELVIGRSLAQQLERRRLTPLQWLAVLVAAGRGLEAAHEAGLIHRDFKPSNVLLADDGRVLVGDFGLARPAWEDDSTRGSGEGAEVRDAPPNLTRTGATLGTPAYMSPEQHQAQHVDALSDQYAFCVSLFEAVYGSRPFQGRNTHELLDAKLRCELQASSSTAPPRLLPILKRGLSPTPRDRFGSMTELLAELERLGSRGRWRLGAVAAAGVATVVGGGLVVLAFDDPCEDRSPGLYNAWATTMRPEVGASLLATDVAFAPDVWRVSAARLDAYALHWAATWSDACAATFDREERSEAEFDLQMQCLSQRRGSFEAVVDVLGDADAKIVENAVATVAGLPPIAPCADLERLRESVAPPPRDVAEAVAQVRSSIARAEATRTAGRPDEALALARSASDDADATGYAAVIVEATHALGRSETSAGAYADAESTLKRAFWDAQAEGHDRLAALAAIDLVRLVGYYLVRREDAVAWAGHADAAVRRLGSDPMLEADFRSARGSTWMRLGLYDEARADFVRAQQHFEKKGAGAEQQVAAMLNNLGGLALHQGRHAEAKAFYRRSLELNEHTLGANHPALATAEGGLGAAMLYEGDFDGARNQYERAYELRRMLGDDHPAVAVPLNNLGIVHLRLGDRAESLRLHRKALALRERTLEPDHPNIAESLNNVGVVLQEQEQPGEALPYFQRALEIQTRRLGAEHPDLIRALTNLGIVLRQQERFEDALEHHERAVAIAEGALAPEHQTNGRARLAWGETLLAAGKRDEAKPMLEAALKTLANANAPALLVSQAQFSLAKVLFDEPEHQPRAIDLLRRARATLEADPAAPPEQIRDVNAWVEQHGL